jgi:peptidoglycan/LPS O-acetylase OafA/YrhL
MDINKRVYFPGLNALRFLAALSVIIGHVELLKHQLGLESNHNLFLRINFGGLGVYFFFVLSGFLITYLLFIEEARTGTINVKKFYWRRILRIWPLYYFITLLGLFVLPHFELMHIPWLQQYFESNFYWNAILFVLMLPNLALSFMPALPHAGQLWSISIEEQFYLLWPVLIKKAKNKLKLIISSIIVVVAVKVFFVLIIKTGIIPESNLVLGVKKMLAMSKFECMLIGALGAFILKEKEGYLLAVIYNKGVFISSILVLPFLSYLMYDYANDIIHLPYSILFLIIIMNVSTNSKSIIKLENKVFSFLGKISYGLYMYHMMIIVFLIRMGMGFISVNSIWFNIYVYIFTLIVSILIATASYYWLETPFLKLKNKYTIIKSGSNK